MKLRSSLVQSAVRIGMIAVVMTILPACGAVGRLVGSADDVGRAIGRNGDDMVRRVGGSADDAIPAGKGVGAEDVVPALPHSEGQPPKVVQVTPRSDRLVDALIEQSKDQLVEVSVDCVTGILTPAGAVAAEQQDSVVQSVCSQIVGKTTGQGTDQGAEAGATRTVKAGEGYANLRTAPSTEVAIVATIPNGTRVTLLEETQNSSGQHWYRVEVEGQTGWVFAGLLD